MPISIRRAGAGDSGSAADLWLRARSAASATIPPPVHSDDAVREWFATHVSQRCELWLAEDGIGRFYERHGFVEAGHDDGAGNEEVAPAVLYTWRGEDEKG